MHVTSPGVVFALERNTETKNRGENWSYEKETQEYKPKV